MLAIPVIWLKPGPKGDILIVGVSGNAEIKLLKGHDRPIVDESARAEMIASLMVVDYVYYAAD